MQRTRTSFALMGLGLGALVAAAAWNEAAAQSGGTEPPASSPEKGPAAASGKLKPPAADGGGAPKVAKQGKQAKLKAERATPRDPPLPPATATAVASGHPAAAGQGKPAAASGKPAAGTAAATSPAKLAGTTTAPASAASGAANGASGAATVATSPAPGTGGTPKSTPAPVAAAKPGPKCSLDDPEQPRGGRLDVIGTGFGASPLVRVAGKPVRMIERRDDRISVQVPADSDGGPVALQAQGVVQPCGTLVIIGKNR